MLAFLWVLTACSSEGEIASPSASALTVEVTGGWAQKGYLQASSRLDFIFDNAAGANEATVRVLRVDWKGANTHICSNSCPAIAIPAGAVVDHVLQSSVTGGDAFDYEPDCSTTTDESTAALTVHLDVDGAASTLTTEVAAYCLACDEHLANCVSFPSDPPE